jgi:ABC-type nitrate/sulfonate/bicarbonate transport system substrate-binding protein
MLIITACQGVVVQPISPTEAPVEAAAPQETESEEPAETAGEVELVPVRVSVAPYFDYQAVTLADQLGWDEELSIDLQLTYMADDPAQVAALTNGSTDVSSLCLVCAFKFYAQQPELRTFVTTNQFKGFAVIGRMGEAKTYDELLEELGDPEQAKQATLEQFKGSNWAIHEASFRSLISAMLSQAGMTLDDINIISFADDQKAALAFIRGEGDFYTGSLPQEARMLQDFPDQFVNVGGHEIIGPAGLWYSNYNALESWLQNNEDAALKLMAMNYRYNRMVLECPDKAAPLLAEVVNTQTGSNFTPENVLVILDEFEQYRLPEQDKAETFSPDSDAYWGHTAEFYMKEQISTGEVPEGTDPDEFNPMKEWLDKLLAREDLMSWINAPGVCE